MLSAPIYEFYKKRHKHFYIDVETSSLLGPKFGHTIGYCYGWGSPDEHNYYFPTSTDRPDQEHLIPSDEEIAEFFTELKKIILDQRVRKVAHNMKFDIKYIAHDLGISTYDVYPFEDTMAMAYCCNSAHKKDLKYLGRVLCIIPTTEKDELHEALKARCKIEKKNLKQMSFASLDVDMLTRYGKQDVYLTKRVHRAMLPRVKAYGAEKVYKTEIEVIRAVAEMESNGIPLAENWKTTILPAVVKEVEDLEKSAYAVLEPHQKKFRINLTDFNMASNKQLPELLMNAGIVLPETAKSKEGKRSYSTADGVLKRIINDPAKDKHIRDFLKKRSLFLKKNNMDKFSYQGRAFAEWSTLKTVTGRFSSYNPNMQNIKGGSVIRDLFVAPKNYTMFFLDYSQMEVCVFAHYSQSKRLIEAINRGEDMHTWVSKEVLFKNG